MRFGGTAAAVFDMLVSYSHRGHSSTRTSGMGGAHQALGLGFRRRVQGVSEPMRVVVVNQSGGLYGIERMLLALLPALRTRGVDVTFLALCREEDEGGALGRLLREQGIPVHFVPITRFVGLGPLRRVVATLRACDPHVVHVHGYKAATAVGLARLLWRRPVLATVHSESASSKDMRAAMLAETTFCKSFERVIAVSTGVLRDLQQRGVARDRLAIIQNGIVDRFAVVSADPRGERDPARIVAVGRLVAVKRFAAAIHSVAALVRQGHPCTLQIVGDGPLRPELERLADELGVSAHVQFVGFVDEVTPFLAGASIFAMPSASEGAPMALLEAMAAGCAIVASRVGGIPDIIRHEEDALLIDPTDETDLTRALERLLLDVSLRERFATSARRRFLEEFEAQRMSARYVDAYSTVAAGDA